MLPRAQLALLALTLGLAGALKPSAYTEEAQRDAIPELPGHGAVEHFSLFGGYVTVDEEAGRELYYVFAESEGDADAHPLVLWLNGGPGCSSLGGGFMSELGPFYPTPEGQLVRNGMAWNRVANVLFLESPTFVGFSHSNCSSDIQTGDRATAQDARTFLLRWLDRFPQFKGRPFWIAGESYGGHYIPNLAAAILDGDNGRDSLNLQGFLVGNALTDPAVDSEGAIQFWWFHGMVSDAAAEGILGSCDFAAITPLEAEDDYVTASPFPPKARAAAAAVQRRSLREAQGGAQGGRARRCQRYIDLAMQEISVINIYDIYADVCLPGAAPARQLALMLRDEPAGASTRPLISGKYDPCIDNEVELYFNRPEVQAALHANVSGSLPGPWTTCNQELQYSRRDLLSSMLPVYRRLLRSDIKMLVYSGDVDAIVPLSGSRRWTHGLGLPTLEAWRAWRGSDRQVAGWTIKYDGLTFATVRGAGHMVPYSQASRAFDLFARWVHGEDL